MPDQLLEHPTADLLHAFSQGRLAGADFTLVAEHVAACESCCRALEDPPVDSFVAGLQVAAQGATLNGHNTPTFVQDIPPELANHPRYRVSGLIGQGGMGAVYKAVHVRLQRTVALKVINPALTKNPQTVERFHQEARATARLSHPNIVSAYDADQAGDLHFLVMEFVEGQTLADMLAQRGALPVAETCAYIRQAAHGLQHLHEAGLIHRDVKPHNLMVAIQESGIRSQESRVRSQKSGQAFLTPDSRLLTPVVKLLDCGLARFVCDAEGPATSATTQPHATLGLTAAGAVMGTADYIAPEQAADPHGADIRADIYSLGCTLFHLLIGRVPFPEGSVTQKLADHARTPLPRLKQLRPDLPQALEDVFARMTAKDPAQRYQTPAEVAQALSQLARNESVPTARRRRRGLVAAALFLAAVIAVIVILRIPTDRGEIVIQSDDPNLELVATKGGEIVRIRDGKSGQTLELDTKNYRIRDLQHPGGLAVEIPWRGKVTLRSSGGKVVVTDQPIAAKDKEPAKSQEPVAQPKKPERLPAPGAAVGQEKRPSAPLTLKTPFPPNLLLVRAKLTEIDRRVPFANPPIQRFTIEQVFAGPAAAKGKTFSYAGTPFTSRDPALRQILLGSQLGVGTEMIVWVRPAGAWPKNMPLPESFDDVHPRAGGDFLPIMHLKEIDYYEIRPFPYVKSASSAGGYRPWEEGLAWAELVQRIYQAKNDEERGDQLRHLAIGQAFQPDAGWWGQAEKPDLQARRWALAMLCNGASAEARKQWQQRAGRDAFSIRDALLLDRMLCRLDGAKWYGSGARIRLLGTCVEAESDGDFALTCRRLTDAVRDQEISFTQLAALIDDRGRKLSEDQQWSLGRLLHAMRFTTEAAPLEAVDSKKSKPFGLLTARERDRAFTWLSGIVTNSSSNVVRVHAAAGLKHLRPFSEREKKALKKLADQVPNADVRAELKALETPLPTQADETAARRAVTTRYDYLISPFYTGGWLVPRDKGWELPMVGKPADVYARPEVIFAGISSYQVVSAELLDLRPALTRDPLLKELASFIRKEAGFFYVVTARGDSDVHFLIRVQRGQGETRGRMPAPPERLDPMEEMVRAAALEFVKAHNVKDMPALDRLVAEKWCHGGQFWIVSDGGKNTLTLYTTPNFGRYGSKEPLGNPGWGPKLPAKLHENILHVSRYEQQRPSFRGKVEELRALDTFVAERGYVVSVGKLDEGGGVALLVRIEKDASKKDTVKIIGAMTGLQ